MILRIMFAIYYKVNLMPTILSLNYTEKTTQTDNCDEPKPLSEEVNTREIR